MSPSFSDKSLVSRSCDLNTLCGISSRFQLLSPSERQVAHTLLTRPPLSQRKLRRISVLSASFDLHVLGTPPAFILSQDQTLYKWYLNHFRDSNQFIKAIIALKEIFIVISDLRTLLWCLFSISFVLTLSNFQGTSRRPLFAGQLY